MALAAVTLGGCNPPSPATTHGEAGTSAAAQEQVTFRARVEFPADHPVPAGTQLLVYLVAANIETGDMETIAQATFGAPTESPAEVALDVPLETLNLDSAYEMSAALVDADGQVLMNAMRTSPPAPTLAIHSDSVFRVRLMPRATPIEAGMIFRLPGPLSLDCGDVAIDVRQEDDGVVVVSMPDEELRLPPAAATAGGRFSGTTHELWLTDGGQAFLLSLAGPQRECAPR